MNLSILSGLLCIFLFFFPFSGLAHGKTISLAADSAVILEPITVTASKRKETVNAFPGNLSVMDDAFMETRGTNALGSLMRFTPNVYIKDTSSGGSIVSRGISTIDTSLFSPMGLYVNDAPCPIGYMSNQDLFDVERVEVLRGPQATLYGRNSESGVINIVLRQPDNEQRSSVFLEGGSHRTGRTGASASGPVVKDTLFYALSFLGHMTDGYNENMLTGKNDVNGEETLTARGTLRWTPGKNWAVRFHLDAATRNLGISALRYSNGPNATDRFNVASNESDDADENERGQSVRINYQWTGMELTAITSHRTFDRTHHLDADRTARPMAISDLDMELDSWAQEIRLASTNKCRLNWLLGFHGRYETIDSGFDFTHMIPVRTSSRSGKSKDLGYAGFGQATYEVMDGLRLTGGLRVDVSHNSGKQTYRPKTGSVSYEKDVDSTEWLPMASLACDLTPSTTAYTTVSRGYLAGGFNFYTATDKDSFAYDAEHTMNYEAGLKTNWLDHALSLNTTIFYTDISDKQVREEIPGAGLGVWKFTNAARAHTQGLELEARYRPMTGLQILAGFGWAGSEVDTWKTTVRGNPVDYSGNKLVWAPEYTYNLGVQYDHANGFFFVGDFLGTGKQYFDAANQLMEDGYETVNLRLGYQSETIVFSISCNNLLNESYTVKQVSMSQFTLVEDGTPRTFGFTFNWRF
ncbi:MAG: TonB-dependent receptor [Deltaproteobacteria bacterium]|nr:MAG: TonB-dependent receptor [Deltaproteobacteria bacterium]